MSTFWTIVLITIAILAVGGVVFEGIALREQNEKKDGSK